MDLLNFYLLDKNYSEYLKPTHKINKLNAKIYRSPYKRVKIDELAFGSKIKITDKKNHFYKFAKGWINKKDTNTISFKEKIRVPPEDLFGLISPSFSKKRILDIEIDG